MTCSWPLNSPTVRQKWSADIVLSEPCLRGENKSELVRDGENETEKVTTRLNHSEVNK